MGSGTGNDLQFGISSLDESAYGTTQTVDRFYPIEVGESLGETPSYVTDDGVYAGDPFDHDPGEVITSVTAGGAVKFALPPTGFGRILDLALGGKAIALHSGQTAVWDQVYTPATLLGKRATSQKGVPRTDGTVEPATFRGSKISELNISLDQNGIVKVEVTFVCCDERTSDTSPASPALATVVYPAFVAPFSYMNASVSLGSVTATTVKSLNVRIQNTLNQRIYMGSGGRTAEPQFSDKRVVDGTIAADFVDRTGWSAFKQNTSLPLVVTFTGQNIPGSSPALSSSLVISVPAVKFHGESPKVGSRDVVSLSHGFVGKKVAGSPIATYTYVTADNAA